MTERPDTGPGGALDGLESADADGMASVREYLGIFNRHKWVILCGAVAGAALASGYISRQKAVYSTAATVVIEPNASKVLAGVDDVSQLGAREEDAGRYYETQYQILVSDSLLGEVFVGLRAKGITPAQERALGADPVEGLRARVKIEPVKNSQIVKVGVTDPDPNMAALIANLLAENYVQHNLSLKTETSRNAMAWLDANSGDLRDKLRASEVALNQFKRDNGVLSISIEEQHSAVASDLTSVMNALGAARIKRLDLAAQVAEVDAAAGVFEKEMALAVVRSNQNIAELEGRRRALQLQFTDVDARYLATHPKVIALRAELSKVEELIKKEMVIGINGLRADLSAVKRFEAGLMARLDALKNQGLDLNSKQVDYNSILRDYETNKSLYSIVLTRSKETNLTGRLENNNVRLLDRAKVPTAPAGPGAWLKISTGTGMGCLAGIVLALALTFFDTTIRSEEDVTARLGVPFLGIIPGLNAGPKAKGLPPADPGAEELEVWRRPTSLTAETCRAIRSNLLFMSPDAPLRTIVVSSPEHADGKTSTAVKLALVLSQTQGRTLIIDSDMRRPRLHKIFGVPNETGLSTIISGECTLTDAVKHTEVTHVDVLTSGRIPPNPVELLHSNRFNDLMVELKERYDLIILDTPPLLSVTDALVLSTRVDGVILVGRWRKTSRDALRAAHRQIRSVHAACLGVILNDVSPSKAPYYYRYRSYGYGGYSSAESQG